MFPVPLPFYAGSDTVAPSLRAPVLPRLLRGDRREMNFIPRSSTLSGPGTSTFGARGSAEPLFNNWTASDARGPLVIPGTTEVPTSVRCVSASPWPSLRCCGEATPKRLPDASNCLKKHNERITNAGRGEATTRGAASKEAAHAAPRDQYEGVLMINSSLRK